MKYLINFAVTSILLCASFNVQASAIEDASNYTVRVKSTISYGFAEEEAGTRNGAGFLVDKERGWIATNAHVSGLGTGEIEISFKGKDFVPVEAVYVDSELDLAVLKVEADNIPDTSLEAELICDDTPLNGLSVAAFGHPHGLSYSASRGIVSQVRFYNGLDWVQTDAAINPGNSGGPLIVIESGKIAGINANSLEDSEGLNFAVPSKPICKILSLLKAGLDPSPPFLPFDFAKNESSEEYLIIAPGMSGDIPEGFQAGDRILSVNGVGVSTPTQIRTLLRGRMGTADVVIQRGEKEIKRQIEIVPEKQILKRNYILADGALIAQDVYPERWALEGYYHVQSVRPGSFAERQGWSKWKLIISIDGVRPKSLDHILELLEGDDEKSIIFRGWSQRDDRMHDYYELSYWPYDVELKFPK
jgi:serine protease Do